MPARSLGRTTREDVTVLARLQGPENDLGERVEAWEPGPQVRALVVPLTLEEVERAGLTVERGALKAFLPPNLIPALPARLRLRGRDWDVLAVERWASRTVATLQEAPP